MSVPFLGELKLASFNFPPKGWALCNGQLLPINQNQALFSLLGTSYGGNGQTNFALPDLRGRVPIHFGNSYAMGQRAGAEVHTLTVAELPTHSHGFVASSADGTQVIPTGNKLAAFNNGYGNAESLVALAPTTIDNTGGSQPHENRSPYLVLNYIIALQGIFPSQS
jgi:microcystin-dependent protein